MSDPYGHAEAVAQIESEVGATCQWSTLSLSCIVGDRAETKELGFGGFAAGVDVTVVIRKELFGTTYPTPQDTVTLTDRTVSVQTVTHAPDGSLIVLGCNDLTGGV